MRCWRREYMIGKEGMDAIDLVGKDGLQRSNESGSLVEREVEQGEERVE